jgi:hypothetical protein
MTHRELKAFISWCHKQGITRIKTGDVEVEFGSPRPHLMLPSQETRELSPEAAEVEAKKQREALLYGSS